MIPGCPICALERGAAEALGGARGWSLRHHPAPAPLAGWVIVDLRRHAATMDELTAEEAAELGPLLVRTCAAIREATGCERVYVLSFAEAARHVHLHLVPRHAGDAATEGWAIADHYRAVASGNAAPALEARVREVCTVLRARLSLLPPSALPPSS